jgi:hypothetical protein
MFLKSLNTAFNLEALEYVFTTTEPGGDIISVLRDKNGGAEWHITLDLFRNLNLSVANISKFPAVKEAAFMLQQATNDSFQECLEQHDFATWIRAEVLEEGLYAITFELHPSVPDRSSLRHIMDIHTLRALKELGENKLLMLKEDARSAVRMAAEHNLETLELLTSDAFLKCRNFEPYSPAISKKPPAMNI